MAKTAREEGFTEIADWFETLAKAEKSHAGRFAKAAALSNIRTVTLGSWRIGTGPTPFYSTGISSSLRDSAAGMFGAD